MNQISRSFAAVALWCQRPLLLGLILGSVACSVPEASLPPADTQPLSATEAGRPALRDETRQPTAGHPPGETADDLPSPYVIQAGDLIEVSVWKNAELSRTVLVRPDGRISLPLLNEIPAAGRSAPELRALVAERLAEYVSTGEVSVIVHEVKSVAVSVIGEVRQPGRYQLQNRTTVLDALAMAGGLTEFASAGGITVLRSDGGQTARLPFSYKKAISPDGADENFVVRAGDIVIVP